MERSKGPCSTPSEMSSEFSALAQPRVWLLWGRKWHFPLAEKVPGQVFYNVGKNFYKEYLVAGSQGD